MSHNTMHVHHRHAEPWRVTLVDTGEQTMTGGRLRRVAQYLEKEEAFCFTYGDGLSDVNISALVEFHRRKRVKATLTATMPPGRFGAVEIGDGYVRSFHEKPQGDQAWINGGFFVLSPEVMDYIAGDESVWEREPIERLAAEGQLAAFQHSGFWQPMDTLRDKVYLEQLWSSGQAPWKVW